MKGTPKYFVDGRWADRDPRDAPIPGRGYRSLEGAKAHMLACLATGAVNARTWRISPRDDVMTLAQTWTA